MLLKFRNKSKKQNCSRAISFDFPDMTWLCRALLYQPCQRLPTILFSNCSATPPVVLRPRHTCEMLSSSAASMSSFGGAGDGGGAYKAAPLGHARPQRATAHVEPPKQRITVPVPVQVMPLTWSEDWGGVRLIVLGASPEETEKAEES